MERVCERLSTKTLRKSLKLKKLRDSPPGLLNEMAIDVLTVNNLQSGKILPGVCNIFFLPKTLSPLKRYISLKIMRQTPLFVMAYSLLGGKVVSKQIFMPALLSGVMASALMRPFSG
jgi:hypothetical protein